MSLETKVIELENQLEKERDKSNTMELELNKISESQIQYDMLAEVRKNYEDNIRLKSEDWEV